MQRENSIQNERQDICENTEFFDLSSLLEDANKLPRGKPFTYGATPLDRVATLQQQLDLVLKLRELTYRDIPDDVPIEIIDYVHTTFANRFHNRAEANEENYMTSLYSGSEFGPEEVRMFKRGELGRASPSELLLTRQLKGIRSVELACLTHPYGKRIKELLPEMRESVQQHVELLSGTYYKEPETRYRVKEAVRYGQTEDTSLEGVLMTRKRTLGEMPDGTIIRERSSFVLRLDDKTPFTGSEITAFNTVDFTQPDWQGSLVKEGHLDEVAAMLLRMDEHSLAIPIATTIYAYNTETAQAIEERDAIELAKRRAQFAKEYPTLAAAMNGDQKSLKVAEFRGDMFYYGPADHSKDPIDI